MRFHTLWTHERRSKRLIPDIRTHRIAGGRRRPTQGADNLSSTENHPLDEHGRHDGHEHDHNHEHSELSDVDIRVRALESLLIEKGYVDRKTLDVLVDIRSVHLQGRCYQVFGANIAERKVKFKPRRWRSNNRSLRARQTTLWRVRRQCC